MSWGNTYTTKLNNIRACQNKCIKNKFFASKEKKPYTIHEPAFNIKIRQRL